MLAVSGSTRLMLAARGAMARRLPRATVGWGAVGGGVHAVRAGAKRGKITWYRFRDKVFPVWPTGEDRLDLLQYVDKVECFVDPLDPRTTGVLSLYRMLDTPRVAERNPRYKVSVQNIFSNEERGEVSRVRLTMVDGEVWEWEDLHKKHPYEMLGRLYFHLYETHVDWTEQGKQPSER